MDPLSGVWEAEQRIQERTERELADVCEMWLHGIRLLGGNIESVDRWSAELERDHAMLAILTHATNTQIAAYRLAIAGYYLQAQGLVRVCQEDNVAWIYLWHFPEEANRFLDFNPATKDTPRWNEMKTKLEAKLGAQVAHALQDQMNWLHKLTHVDRLGVRGSYEVHVTEGSPTTNAHFRLGPYYDRDDFINSAGQFMIVLNQLIYESIGMCQLVGVTPKHPDAKSDFESHFEQWIKKLEEEDPTPPASSPAPPISH